MVTLHFLRPGEMRAEIARLVTYHEQLLGRPQRQFSHDDARALVGDYRMAHCLIATLSAWYHWRNTNWDEALRRTANSALSEAGITSPIQLRLALYNYVNEHYKGFLDAQVRAEALEHFAALHHLSAHDLEYLLALDIDEDALLAREGNTRIHIPMQRVVKVVLLDDRFQAGAACDLLVHRCQPTVQVLGHHRFHDAIRHLLLIDQDRIL